MLLRLWGNVCLVQLVGAVGWHMSLGATVGCGRSCRSHGPTGQLHCAYLISGTRLACCVFLWASSLQDLRPVFAGFRFTLHNCTSANPAWDAGHLLDHIEDVESLGSLSRISEIQRPGWNRWLRACAEKTGLLPTKRRNCSNDSFSTSQPIPTFVNGMLP